MEKAERIKRERQKAREAGWVGTGADEAGAADDMMGMMRRWAGPVA